jgi:tRNA (guanine-N7-)-methyltransferase
LGSDPRGLTAAPPPLWLEIGFGGAEHLIWQAERNPHATIIGCEPFEEGVVKALAAIQEKRLTNVRIHPDDAREVLRALPAASLGRVFILFPDPWPKRKHVKRRLVSRSLLDQLARVMAPGAELRIATDIGDYVRTILIALADHPAFVWQAAAPDDWRARPADWPQTRYEQKALREGRRGYFLRFVRRGA